jgi:hypothetical protein
LKISPDQNKKRKNDLQLTPAQNSKHTDVRPYVTARLRLFGTVLTALDKALSLTKRILT